MTRRKIYSSTIGSTYLFTTPKRKLILFTLIFIALNFISSIIAISPIFHQSGWPVNHEGSAFALRTIYYANAIKSGDIIPIWSPEENHGLGSPMQLYYPRLFSMVAAFILLVTGTVKFSLCLTIILFSAIGSYGLFLICRELTLGYWQALIVSLVFPHLNYAQIDFLVRGAMAEYAAMCLLPFLVWWCLRLLGKKEFSWSIIWLLILCGLAHAGIAMYNIFMLGAAAIIALVFYQDKRKYFLYRASVSAILIAIPAVPYVLLMLYFNQYFNFFMYKIYVPWDFYLPWTHYFIDNSLSRKALSGISPQLDFMFLTVTPLLLVLYFILNGIKLLATKNLALRNNTLACCGIFLCFSLLFYSGLQLPFSMWFYKYIPCMDSIQFPFRLISFISILLITAYIYILRLLHVKLNRKILWILVLIPCIGTLIISLSRPLPTQWISNHGLEHPQPCNWREYTPATTSNVRAFSPWIEHIAKLPAIVAWGKPETLFIKRSATGKFMTVDIFSKSPLEITLPAVWSKHYLILIERSEGIYKLSSFRRGFDPRICIQIPPGQSKITVKYPSLSNICEQFFYLWLPTSESLGVNVAPMRSIEDKKL